MKKIVLIFVAVMMMAFSSVCNLVFITNDKNPSAMG